MTVYQATYEIVSPHVAPYETFYPFMENQPDLNKGYCSFVETVRRNITSGDRRQIAGGFSKVSSSIEIEVEINIAKFFDYTDMENSAPERATYLQTYLMSDEALGLFYEKGFELAPVHSDVKTEGYLSEDKKYAQKSTFGIKLYTSTELVLPSQGVGEARVYMAEMGELKLNEHEGSPSFL